MIGRIYTNPEGARFRVVGRLTERIRGRRVHVAWISRNLDQVFAVAPGALWRRRALP